MTGTPPLPSRGVEIVDVSPRYGPQSEPSELFTSTKVALIGWLTRPTARAMGDLPVVL